MEIDSEMPRKRKGIVLYLFIGKTETAHYIGDPDCACLYCEAKPKLLVAA